MVEPTADREFMRIALVHAARGTGRTSPNPLVGSVVVAPGGVIVGTGYHRRAGEPHAEIHALRSAGRRAAGAALYCTLEPCCHRGRTGPCVEAIVEAGVTRVVAPVSDPNPLVAGRGFAFLREHGVEVTTGIRAAEAEALNAAFFTAIRTGRPHVTLKVATSADARVAAGVGTRTPLTSRQANRRVQAMRAASDAIAVGSGTMLADDPLLTVREVYRERPFLRVVFDRRLRLRPDARVLRTVAQGPVLVFSDAAEMERQPGRIQALRDAGAEVVAAAAGALPDALRILGAREVRSLLLEGGPALHRAAWAAGVVDRVAVFVTPGVLGPQGVPWEMPADFSLASMCAARVVPLGPDVLMEADVHRTH